MKKMFTFILLAAVCVNAAAQVPGACGKNKYPVPYNGNDSLGQSFNQTACGLNYVQASKLIETRFDQYTTAGNLGSGLPVTLPVSGLPASGTVLKAFVWYFVSYTEATAPSTTITLTNPASNTASMSSIIAGTSQPKCWGETGTAVYRADVTSAIAGNGNYILNIAGFSNPAWEVDGATLFIIYKDLNANYQGSLAIWDGAMVASGTNLSQTGSGFNVCSSPTSARAFAISSDHQDNIAPTHPTTLNGVVTNFPNNMYNFDEAQITLTSGQTASTFGESDGGNGDCYLWGAMGLYYQTTNCTVCSPCLTTTITIDSVKNTSACALNNGAVYLSAYTTAPPLQYTWSNGATTQDITGLFPGTYFVSIKDSANCTSAFTFTVSSPANIIIFFDSITTVSCNGNNGAIHSAVSGGTPPYTYNWSNGATTQNVSGLPYGSFTLKVTDSNGCIAVSSAAFDGAPGNVPAPSICMVTVDSLSQYNVIMWDKASFASTDSFIVYREIGTNNYQPIGAVPYSALSLFVDTLRTKYFPNTGDPNAGTYRYKLGVHDSCGNASTLSPYHNTIYIQNNNGSFSWSQLYTIENSANPVISYVLMRDDNTTGNWHSVNSVAGTQQTVTDPSYQTYKNTASWRVETQWNITCTPAIIKDPVTESFISSRSNLFNAASMGVNEWNDQLLLSVTPNPSNGTFAIQMNNAQLSTNNYHLVIYNVLGEKMYQSMISSPRSQISLDVPDGIYFLQISSSGGTAVKKIVISK